MFTIVILEDDPNQKKRLEEKVKQLNLNFQYRLVSFTKADEMIRYCEKKKEHFIFLLDVVLGNNYTGIDVASYINKHFKQSYIIYITAYLEKACEVYDTEHCYFIYKPQVEHYLKKAILKAIDTYHQEHQEITVKTKEGLFNLNIHQIIYIERIKRYSLIKYHNQIIKTTMTLDEYMKLLPNYFQYCHSCYIVNFNQVKMKTKNEFMMKDESILPIARGYGKEVENAFHNYLIHEMNGGCV